MDIQSALKETGKAKHKRLNSNDYATLRNGVLMWFTIDDPLNFSHVSTCWVTDNDWEPYHPEPEKCEACVDSKFRASLKNEHQATMAEHLRKYHCTCKDKKTL